MIQPLLALLCCFSLSLVTLWTPELKNYHSSVRKFIQVSKYTTEKQNCQKRDRGTANESNSFCSRKGSYGFIRATSTSCVVLDGLTDKKRITKGFDSHILHLASPFGRKKRMKSNHLGVFLMGACPGCRLLWTQHPCHDVLLGIRCVANPTRAKSSKLAPSSLLIPLLLPPLEGIRVKSF